MGLPQRRIPRKGVILFALAGTVLGLVFLGSWAFRPVEDPTNREFQEFFQRISSHDPGVAFPAATEISSRKELLRGDRLDRVLAVFSGPPSRPLEESSIRIASSFWGGALSFGSPSVVALLPNEVARLRRAVIVSSSRHQRLAAMEGLGHDQVGAAAGKAIRDLRSMIFGSSALAPEALGALLWDRANLEEMAASTATDGLDALEKYKLLSYDRVRNHPEFGDRRSYLLAKADLLGRIGGLIPATGPDLSMAALLELASDRELAAFGEEEDKAVLQLLEAIRHFHRGDPSRAAEAASRYLASAGAAFRGGAIPPGGLGQVALLIRGTARAESASLVFRKSKAAATSPSIPSISARTHLRLKRARLLASAEVREEFEEDLVESTTEDRKLLEALGKTIWEPGEKGAAELRRILAFRRDLPDRVSWEEVAAGLRPPVPLALYEAGRICDELEELPRLERIIGRLESAIENESDEAYLKFLRAVLRLRKDDVQEAWDEMEELLDREVYPTGLTRIEVARFMEGAEDAVDLLARARTLLEEAEKDLISFRDGAPGIHEDLAVIASVRRWKIRCEGEQIDPKRSGRRLGETPALLHGIVSGFRDSDRRSYARDRAWLEFRNSLARRIRGLARAGRHAEALDGLGSFTALLAVENSPMIRIEEAAIRMDLARIREKAGEREGVEDAYRRAGLLFLDAAERMESAGNEPAGGSDSERGSASIAFERIGDHAGIIRSLSPVEKSLDKVLLLRLGKACLDSGHLTRAQSIARRILTMGEEIEHAIEEPIDGSFLGGQFFHQAPKELLDWLDLSYPVDPSNGTGTGRLRYDPIRRALQWRAPGEARFGPPAFLLEGEPIILASGEDPRKTVTTMLRPGVGIHDAPPAANEWDLAVEGREAMVDPVNLEARLLHAEAALRLGRLPSLPDLPRAAAFIERNLASTAPPWIRDRLLSLSLDSLEGLLGDPDPSAAATTVAALSADLDDWKTRIAKEMDPTRHPIAERLRWLREIGTEIDSLSGARQDPARLGGILMNPDGKLRGCLRRFHSAVLERRLEMEGREGATWASLEDLAAEILDTKAREELIFLCEIVGNRSMIWKRAMLLRANQALRRAEDARKPGSRRPPSWPLQDPDRLGEEARDLFGRLLARSDLTDGPVPFGRAVLALARLEARAGRPEEAGKCLDRLAQDSTVKLEKSLGAGDREAFEGILRTAAFARADHAWKTGDIEGAISRYTEAIDRHGGSSLVLWAHLQLGKCYEVQGLPEAAHREYRKGLRVLEMAGGARESWIDMSRSARDGIRAVGPEGEKEGMPGDLEESAAGSGKEFWKRLFDERIAALAKR